MFLVRNKILNHPQPSISQSFHLTKNTQSQLTCVTSHVLDSSRVASKGYSHLQSLGWNITDWCLDIVRDPFHKVGGVPWKFMCWKVETTYSHGVGVVFTVEELRFCWLDFEAVVKDKTWKHNMDNMFRLGIFAKSTGASMCSSVMKNKNSLWLWAAKWPNQHLKWWTMAIGGMDKPFTSCRTHQIGELLSLWIVLKVVSHSLRWDNHPGKVSRCPRKKMSLIKSQTDESSVPYIQARNWIH